MIDHNYDDPAVIEAEYRREHLERAWRDAIPRRFWQATIDAVDLMHGTDVAAALLEWTRLDPTPNLVILGPVGTGKTWAAAGALRPLHFSGRSRVRFMPVGEMLDALRPGGPEDQMGRLCGAGVLLIDDIGTERGTDWTAERLFSVVNRRWLEHLPTITTSNLSPVDLASAVGERTFSRLVGSDAIVLTLRGQDHRRGGCPEPPEPPSPTPPPAAEVETVVSPTEARARIAALRVVRRVPEPPPPAARPTVRERLHDLPVDAHSMGDHQFCGPDCVPVAATHAAGDHAFCAPDCQDAPTAETPATQPEGAEV